MTDTITDPETPDPTIPAGAHPASQIRWWMIAVAGVAVVLLAFGGAFWGARAAQSTADDEQPSEEIVKDDKKGEKEDKEKDESIPVLPAGADMRAGIGVPDPAHGDEGDILIDIQSADVFVRTATGWSRAGNIRTSARENLTGDQGEQGQAGAQGKPGAQGEAGRDGTQVVLGLKAPTGSCDDGDVFVNTVDLTFYSCTDGEWEPSGERP